MVSAREFARTAPYQEHTSWFTLTRRGWALKTAADVAAYQAGALLPQGLLANELEEKVRPMFLRGDYDVGIFQAFKELEVAVREQAPRP